VVLTLASLSKYEKVSTDPLSSVRSRLEQLDIKFIHEYIYGQTTHVVAEKRNLPPVLRALVHANYAVTDKFMDAIVEAAKIPPKGDDGRETFAPLELNFDGVWPDAADAQFVPPPSKEPNPRPAEYFAPKEERGTVFYGYTFVFCQKQPYENLGPAINGGSGKALLYEASEATPARDVVAYVKNAAGNKELDDIEDESEEKGVIVVRIATKNSAWSTKFMNEVDEQLNQRSVQQNEFLDPIVMNDASGLRQKLVEEDDMVSTAIRKFTLPRVFYIHLTSPSIESNSHAEPRTPKGRNGYSFITCPSATKINCASQSRAATICQASKPPSSDPKPIQGVR
jgi:nijmegen breakage syndrome protein 1